jgi:hypothetical protein
VKGNKKKLQRELFIENKRQEQLMSLYEGERNKLHKLKDNVAQEKKKRKQLQSLEAKQNRVRAAEHKHHGIKVGFACAQRT